MTFWRIAAAVLGSSLMIGETIRSWGQGRNPLAVLDDFLVGVPLVVTAVLMRRPTPARCCAFSASFAAAAGALYGSFFSKVLDPSRPVHSNIDFRLLTGLIGLAFAISLAGLVASVILSRRALEGAVSSDRSPRESSGS
jgi:hypothetical protein